MSTPLVSVIVPNYNYARYLPERIDSILSQTFRDFELIILDDFSTDSSREVIERYRSNPKVSHIIYNEKNSGSPFPQWFKGINLAKGKYIWIAEADDSATPGFLEKMVNGLESNPSAALAISGSTCIDAQGNTTMQTFDRWDQGNDWGEGETRLFTGAEYLIHNLYWACYIYNASCVVFRKQAFHSDDYSASLKMRNAGDWLFWSRMLLHGDMLEIREKLSFLRRHNQCVTAIGNASGNLFREDAKVVHAIEGMTRAGWYRRAIRHGEMLKRASRLPIDSAARKAIRKEIKKILGASEWEYILERINKPFAKYFGFIITSKSDII